MLRNPGSIRKSVSARGAVRSAVSYAALATAALAASAADAQAVPNVVSACAGVSLPPSVVTGIMAPVINGVASPLQGRVNALGSGLGGLPLIPTLSIDTTGLLQNAASGQPVTLQVLNANGQVVGPNDRCDLQATSYGLDTQGGIAIGGNSITGLGTNGLAASAGEANSIAFGNSATTDATALRSIALGTGAHTDLGAVGSVALGAGADALGANSVALGANSVAARGATTAYTALGLALPQNAAGEVSVGAVGGERQITNVAAGVAATDAVNVGQLTGVNARITTTADAVTNLSLNVNNGAVGPVRYSNPLTPTVPNGGTPTNDVTLAGLAPTTPVGLHNVRAGAVNAVSTDAVNGAQLYALGYDLDSLSGLAVQYDDSTHTRVTLGGTGAAPVALGNVRAGTVGAGSTDAVNGAQLGRLGDQAAAALGGLSHYDPVANSLATELTYNGQAYTSVQSALDAVDSASADSRYFHANSTGVAAIASGAESVAIGPVAVASAANSVALGAGSVAARGATLAYAAPGLALPQTSAGEVSVGAVGAERQITNVAAGVAATDAANVGQVEGIASQVAALGDNAVQYDGPGKTSVTLGGVGGTKLTNVKAGAVTALSTDAVNGAQLYAANQTIAGLNTSVLNNSTIITNLNTQVGDGGIGPVQYSAAGTPTTPDGGVPSQDLTLVGLAPGAVGLHNVAAGVIGAGSTDAVNGGQLAGLGNAVANVFGGNYAYNSGTNSFVGNFSYNGGSYANVQSVFTAIEGDITSDPVTGGSNKYFHTNSTMADSQADGMNSTAVGGDAVSSGESSIAVGNTAIASGDQSVAIGVNATAMNGKAVSIGMGNTASGDGAVSIGDPNVATGDGAAALGKDNTATGIGAVALGNTNSALDDGAVALGNQNSATGNGAVAIGASNVSNGVGAISIGSNNNASGDNSLAIGSGVQTVATDTLAIGNLAGATGNNSVTIGNRSNANGMSSVALGNDANATMLGASAVGQTANATGLLSLALGADTAASGQSSTALGALSSATAEGASALGGGSIADQIDSVALGAGAQTTRGPVANYSAFGLDGSQSSQGEIAIARNVVFTDPNTGLPLPTGYRQITGVAAGSAGTDAVNVSQLQGVSNTLGTVIASGFGGGASYDPTTGKLVGPSYTLGGVTYGNVGDALQALATNGMGGGTGVANPVTYTDNSHGSIDLAAGGTQVHDVAAGAVNASSTDAVNGSQLAAANQQIESTQAAVSSLTTQITNGAIGTVQYSNAATPTTPNGGTVTNDLTLVGAGPAQAVGLHNVAAGTLAAGSTDAVNGSQLYATNRAVATAQTTADSALTLGQNSVQYDSTARTDVTLGDAGTPVTVHNVGPGLAGTDAVNVAQLGQGIGNAITQANSYTDSRIAALSYDLRSVRKDANAGSAGALAAAGLPQPYEAGKGMIAMALGAYGDQTAFAIGLSKAMSDGHTVVKLGGTYDTQQRAGATAGVGYQF